MNETSAAQTTSASSPGLIAPGARIGRYEVVHRIACGGMAEIYLARASGLYGFEKHVVLKRILPQYAANAEFVRMFLKEARVAASLDHANIAHVYDIGETGGSTFFTMEYLHGEDLRHVMRALDRQGQALPLEHALEIVMGTAAGLHFAHEKRGPEGRSLGIVHRDISPANVVVTYDGGVKVVDFGIAKLAADPELSQRYALKGKLAYMAPEQFHNRVIDRRADIFALGVVLYEITTGTRLFKRADEAQTVKAVLEGVVPPPSSLIPGYPAALERIVVRALAQNPDQRYQTARDLQLDLESFGHEERLRVSPAGLAAWMERMFGPKQELWNALPAPAAAPAPSSGEPTAATRIVPPSEIAAAPNAASPMISVPLQISTATPVPRRSGRRVAAAAGLVALGLGGWALAPRVRHPGGVAPSAPAPIVVVAEQGHVALERPEGAAPPPARPAIPPPPPAAQPEPAPAARPRAAAERAPRPASFSAALGRHEAEIRRCFVDHAGALSSSEISLRFDVDREGRATAVDVLPAGVAGTPLGGCLAGVGRRTVFAKQRAPLTFRIPLTVQREPTGSAAGKPGT